MQWYNSNPSMNEQQKRKYSDHALLDQLPLPFVGKKTKIGNGANSVAIRIESDNQARFIAIIKEDNPETRNALRRGMDLRQQFPEFTQDQMAIVTEGLDGEHITVRIGPEIDGGNLNDYGLLYNLSNPTIRRKLVQLTAETLHHFSQTGTLLDWGGRKPRNKIHKALIAANPLSTNNIVASDDQREFIFVDNEVYDTFNWRTASPMYKAVIAIQLAAHVGWATVMGTIEKLSFTDKGLPVEQDSAFKFTDGLSKVIRLLKESGTNYFIVGSTAHAAWCEQYGVFKDLSLHRANGTKRDIDVMIYSSDHEQLAQLQAKITALETDINCPEVSLHISQELSLYQAKQEKRVGKRIKTMFQVPVIDQGQPAAAYDDLVLYLDPSMLEPQQITYKNISIRTLRPEILAGMYIYRGGAVKPKDTEKIKELVTLAGQSIPFEFIEFAREIRRTHRNDYRNFIITEITKPLRSKIRKLLSFS